MEKGKIFWLIDADSDDRALFAYAIKRMDKKIEFEAIENCQKTLDMLSDKSRHLPDVIFLDINIPGTGGWECMDTFKKDEKTKNIPVIIYSTSSDEKDIQRAKELGAISFCNKPEDFMELKRLLSLIADSDADRLSEILTCGDLKCLRF